MSARVPTLDHVECPRHLHRASFVIRVRSIVRLSPAMAGRHNLLAWPSRERPGRACPATWPRATQSCVPRRRELAAAQDMGALAMHAPLPQVNRRLGRGRPGRALPLRVRRRKSAAAQAEGALAVHAMPPRAGRHLGHGCPGRARNAATSRTAPRHGCPGHACSTVASRPPA